MGYKPRVPAKPRTIERRKSDHINVAASGAADFRNRTTLLEQVHLVHHSLPERAVEDIDLETELLGRTLSAPVVISGMTGGTPEARDINRALAGAAGELGLAFGVGSQRAMHQHPELEDTFQVRDAAPDVFLIGNIGAVQARDMGADAVADLARRIDANAMAVHLNPAQELIQVDGDRDFRGQLDTIAALVKELPVPVIAKETGCGLSPKAARSLRDVGVRAVDVSGAGGTSWVAVEAVRAANESDARALGSEFWDWGLPTAVSTAACAKQELQVIATGGLRSGHDVARAIALGATAGGLAAPVLRAYQDGGRDGAVAFLRRVINGVRTVTLLTGCGCSDELIEAPRHLGSELAAWLSDLGLR